MSSRDNYWIRRMNSSRLSRRRFVGGAATVGVGASALALVGCGDDDDDDDGGEPTSASGETPEATATEASSGPVAGGTAHLISANNTWDTFDIDRSRFSPIAWLYGMTNLGIMQWQSFTDGVIEPAFASEYEQVDETHFTFTVRDGLVWHDKPPVNGRAATAEDMAAFVMRNVEGKLLDGTEDTNFYRKAAFAKVASAEATDETTMTVTFSEPDPFFIALLAGSYTKVLAPEAVAEFEDSFAQLTADKVIGTGGFVLEEFAAEGTSSWSKNANFYTQVNWDGVTWLPLFTDQAAQQTAFEQKNLDGFSPTQTEVDEDIQARFEGQISVSPTFSGNPQAGTYYGGSAPWNNPDLIGALFQALDRRNLINTVLQGKAVMSGNVPPTQSAFAITEAELIEYPGYLEDRAADEADAKARWDAAGGPELGDITVDIPDVWEGLYSGGSAVITTNLNRVLGNTFTVKVEPYSTITNKVSNKGYGDGKNNIWYGWITEISDPEPTVLNYLSYNSSSPQWQQFSVLIPEVDTLTAEAYAEFDLDRRIELGKQVQDLLITNYGAGIPYSLVGYGNALRWNYWKFPESVPFVSQSQYATQHWFDQTDPSWEGRPA